MFDQVRLEIDAAHHEVEVDLREYLRIGFRPRRFERRERRERPAGVRIRMLHPQVAVGTGRGMRLQRLHDRRDAVGGIQPPQVGDAQQLEEEKLELEHRTLTDPLTQVLNRNGLAHALQQKYGTQQIPAGTGLLVMDIDHFKTLNDTFGHVAGDAVLREFGEVVGGRLREDDILARWGGEEFVVLLPEADTALVTQVAERIRAEVAAWPFDAIGGCGLTISIGVAFFPEDGTTCRDLLDTADQALYRAKRSGRDQVRFPESAAVQ